MYVVIYTSSSSHLRGDALVGAVGQQVPYHGVVVLLSGHVERREAVLTLGVHVGARLNQQTDNLLLTSCGRERGRRIRGLTVREHPLTIEVHPLTAKSTPSKSTPSK